MAINKKLSNFNTAGDYRNFLATSDFNCSDVSSIGTSIIPDNLDVEYNPCQMLFVNCKYYLPPTATKITPIIDTITNGTIGCWYKQTTASTYTKLNTTDLVFYSAYTQNKITNLQFNTIGIANLKDDSNVEYILSAKSSTDATITATDNCIQRGLITLSASTFPETSGLGYVFIKTAPGNPWKITNTNTWLNFNVLTGVGPTQIAVVRSANVEFDDRIGNVTIEYTDINYSTTGSIIQKGRERTFYWNEYSVSSLTININWDETSVSQIYHSYFTGLTVNGSTSWVTNRGVTNNNGSGTFTATTQQNTGTTSRNCTFSILSNGTTVGTIQIIQAGKPALYFYVGNTLEEATTSACTYSETILSGDTTNKHVFYFSNLTPEEIATLTFEKDAMFDNVSFNTANTQIVFNLKQNGEDIKYFYWGNGSTSAITSGGTATSAQTTLTCTYTTNHTSFVTGSSESWITGATLNNGTLTVHFNESNVITERSADLTIYANSNAVATFTITQAAKEHFFFNDNSGTTRTSSWKASRTGWTYAYTTNMSDLTITTSADWISAVLTNPNGNGNIIFSGTQNTDGVIRETAYFYVQKNGTTIATIIVDQDRGYVRFNEGINTSAITITINSDNTSFNRIYATTLSALTLTPVETYDWINAVNVITYQQVMEGGHYVLEPNPQSGSVTGTTTVNDTGSDRQAMFNISCNGVVRGVLTVKQNKEYPYFRFAKTGDGDSENIFYNKGSEIGPDGLTVLPAETGLIRINTICSGYTNNFTITTDNSAMFTSFQNSIIQGTDSDAGFVIAHSSTNNSLSSRTGSVIIKHGSTIMAKVTVTQEGAEPYFYWYDTGTESATTLFIDATATTLSINYRTNYTKLRVYPSSTFYLQTSGITNTNGDGSFTATTRARPGQTFYDNGINIRTTGSSPYTIVGSLDICHVPNYNSSGITEIIYKADQEHWISSSTAHSFSDVVFKVFSGGTIIATLDASDVDVWWIQNAKRINNDNWCLTEPKFWGDPEYDDSCWRNWAIIDHDTGLFTYREGNTDMGAQIIAHVRYQGTITRVFICTVRYHGSL